MAQFGKHFFGSSYFGKASTFTGVYEAEPIDAGDAFDGKIDLKIKATLPSVSYKADGESVSFPIKTDWTFHGTKATSKKTNAQAAILVCAEIIDVKFETGAGKGSAVLVLKKESTILETKTIDTTTVSNYTFSVPYGDYYLEIKAFNEKPITFLSVDAKVSKVSTEVRTATIHNANGTYNWSAWSDVPLTYRTEHLMGSSEAVVKKRYVQVRIHLASSDTKVSPFIDRIETSSGDISKYSRKGYWYAAIDMNQVSSQSSKTFKKVKRLEWKENQTEKSSSTIRSTSALNNRYPTDVEVKNPNYWHPETAPYTVIRDGTSFGKPYSRISLGEKGNGTFTESLNMGYAVKGPYSPRTASLANTSIIKWLSWDSIHNYPTINKDVKITFSFYKTLDDATIQQDALYEVTSPEKINQKTLDLYQNTYVGDLYLGILIERIPGRQSPVVDRVDMYASMQYTSPRSLGSYSNLLSGLDGLENNEIGKKKLRDLNVTDFNFPSEQQTLEYNREAIKRSKRNVSISYTPKYPSQTKIGFGKDQYFSNKSFMYNESADLSIWSEVIAQEPSASTFEVKPDRIYWHYNYDGGNVGFPNTTERDLGSDFTPNLIQRKMYRFQLTEGWMQESFVLPKSMQWEEIAENFDVKLDELIGENPNTKLYNGKVPSGIKILLPNYTKNPNVSISFVDGLNGNFKLTEKSSHNKNGNDRIRALIPSLIEKEVDWTSEEVIFKGILNKNNEFSSYVQTKFSSTNNTGERIHKVNKDFETAKTLADLYFIDKDSIVLENNGKEKWTYGELVVIPGNLTLPALSPDAYFLEENPYKITIIEDSVKKTLNNKRLKEEIVEFGSQDEQGISYKMIESEPQVLTIKHSSVLNTKDVLPYAKIFSVSRIQNVKTGVVYTPYKKTGTTEVGDYQIIGNVIDWSTANSGSKEPAANEELKVTLTYGIVDYIKIVATSKYKEQISEDRLWRSKEIKTLKGTVTPSKDIYLPLPKKEEFTDFNKEFKKVEYIVEDNDLWVQTSIKDNGNDKVLFATLNGEDPKRNWYPTIETGFYYLNDQEYYLYSEPIEHEYGKEHIPIVENVIYKNEGISLV